MLTGGLKEEGFVERNALAEVTALAWFPPHMVGNLWCLEQPAKSVLPLTSSMASV